MNHSVVSESGKCQRKHEIRPRAPDKSSANSRIYVGNIIEWHLLAEELPEIHRSPSIRTNDTDQPGRVKDSANIPDTTPPSVASDGYDVLLRPRYPFRATPPSVEPRASFGLFVAVSIPHTALASERPSTGASREAFDPAADHLAFHPGPLVHHHRAIWPSLVTDLSAVSGVAFHAG